MFSVEVRGFHALFSSAARSCMVSPRGGSAQFPLAHSVGLRDAPMESPQAKGSKARGNRRCFDNVESTEQGSSSCPQVVLVRSPEDSRPPSEEGLYCLKHCRQIQLCKSFVYMEKIGYVLYKGCSVRLETHSWKLQTACFGTCIYHS